MEYNSWEDIEDKDLSKYIAVLNDDEWFDVSGFIDAGALLRTMVRNLQGYKFLNKDILEFGCGIGRMSKYLRKFFKEYYACDISQRMLNVAKNRAGASAYIKTDGTKIDLPDNSVDIVFTFTVLMHNRKDSVPIILKELRRVLKPGGYLYFQLPCYKGGIDLSNFCSVAIWTRGQIEQLAEGFDIVKIEETKREMGSKVSNKHFKYHIFKKK